MEIEINTDNIIVADITRYFRSVKQTNVNNTANEWYENVGKICALTEYIVSSKELKPILDELDAKLQKIPVDFNPKIKVQPYYALHKLRALLLAWYKFDNEEANFESYNIAIDTNTIDKLTKQIDSLSAGDWSEITLIDEFGDFYDDFKISDYEEWAKILVEYLLPLIPINTSNNHADKLFTIPNKFVFNEKPSKDNLCFDQENGHIYKGTIKGKINFRILSLLLRNPGKTIKKEDFIDGINIENNDQIKHAIFPIRQKLNELHAPFEIVSKGNNGSYALQEK